MIYQERGKMDKIDTLIAYLFAIQAFAKDIHYSAKGEAFYSKHLLADEIYKGIDEQIDALIETCILSLQEPATISDYWKQAIEFIPELSNNDSSNFKRLYLLIKNALILLNGYSGPSRGGIALIDNVAQDLQRKLGLITRQVE